MLRGRRSHRAAPVAPPGVLLGQRLLGEAVLPISAAGVVWPFEQMRRHALILGASGTGKTETSMRIAHQLAAKSEAQVFYLDAKGDRGAAERFCGLMVAAGRSPRVFPNQPFDAWRGDWRAIVNRLLEVIEFAREGPAAYYRDVAKTALQLACEHPDGPPRSSAELLARLDYERLLNAHGAGAAVLSLPRDKLNQVRIRYQAFFGQLASALDGDWSWEDADAAYLLLDSVALGEDSAGTARMLFTDFAHYFSQRKPRPRFCVLFVDEFAAIAAASDVAIKVEQARGFNAGIVLVPQNPAGMGPATQRDRILGSVETLIVHAVNQPEEIAALAGRRRVLEITHQLQGGLRSGWGHAREERRPKLDPDQIRTLPAGNAWVIRRGRAAKLAIERAPGDLSAPLPPPEAPATRPQPAQPAAPKRLSYLEEEED